ncbi:glycoside hydrolase family 36 protein [Aestuariimicrobium ganziense]|uniref:glycoside hydrolase family 36 protein n=1 Tax=Aestuariimicrobium ganziense TaxID=2773677 RepID=UPI0019459A21|nr:glycoside hydrolase family 36 protein [Aestuariimicrobium ganziense]
MSNLTIAPDFRLSIADGGAWQESRAENAVEVVVDVPAGTRFEASLVAPLGMGVGLWHPDMRGHRTLPPDWGGRFVTSLVRSAPVIALYDAIGQALWTIGCSHLVGELEVRGGVSEEQKDVRLSLTSLPLAEATTITLVVHPEAAALPEAVEQVITRLAASTGVEPLPLPEAASEPVFSTWYTYTQDVKDELVRQDARLSAELGCRSLFIDDGWQTGAHGRGYGGTGDWVPDTDKFPDLKATIAAAREAGVATVLWIAPLLLGHFSHAHERMRPYAPSELTGLNAQVLDPRHAEVREFVADTCRRVVADHGAAGLKIDFLNNAMAYQGTESAGDIADVGVAMQAMLAQVRQALSEVLDDEPIIEFRQPYVSPAITADGNCLRVGDCPADAWVNRVASIDLRLFVRGAVVHSDPLMWAPEAGADAVAQQFLSTFFSVPQVSMPLPTLSDEQRASVTHHVGLWRAWRQPALFGDMKVAGVEMGYTTASATLDRRAVVAAFRPEPLLLDDLAADEVLVLNAQPGDRVLLRGSGWSVDRAHTPDGSPLDVELPGDATGLVEVALPAWSTMVLRRG